MVEIPEGYTELELVGFTDKGSYADGTSYVKNDLVHYGGAIYKCIVDDTVDVLPSNTSCWEVFILNHSNLDSIIAVDTEGKLGAKGEEVSAQQLVDKISRDTNKMVGATSETDGSIGLVPQPKAGDEDKALLGNGTWGKVDSIYKYKTEEEYNQAVSNNEIPDGATVIKEWDEELSVIPVDSELSEESLNPLQNKVIAQKISELNQSIAELNGLLGGKLDVSKIANNLITTEEGYVLDARMGKALSDRVDSIGYDYTLLASVEVSRTNETIPFNDNILNYKYVLVVRAYYPNLTAIYGHIFIPSHIACDNGEFWNIPTSVVNGQFDVTFNQISFNNDGSGFVLNRNAGQGNYVNILGIK